MPKKGKGSKKDDWDEDYEAPAKKSGGKRKGKKGGRKRSGKKSAKLHAWRPKSPGQVISVLKKNRGLKLVGTPKAGYRIMLRKTDTNLPISTVKAAWKHIKGKVYLAKMKKAAGGVGVIIRGTGYLKKI